jgi:uncharacterized protein
MRRDVVWRGTDAWRAEAATLEFVDGGLRATGTQIGAAPGGYRLDYRLDATDGWRTRSLELAIGDRRVLLERDDGDRWRLEGDPRPDLDGAQDCDLAFSPLTNLMPIRRRGLADRPGAEDFLMAWMTVPELTVIASAQRYEHVRRGLVRFVDRGLFEGFTAELELDEDGLARVYPGLAEQVVRDLPR